MKNKNVVIGAVMGACAVFAAVAVMYSPFSENKVYAVKNEASSVAVEQKDDVVMEPAMKNAYKNMVNKFNFNDSLYDANNAKLVDFYLTDMNNDGKNELLVSYGAGEADLRTFVFTYDGKDAVYAGCFASGHSILCGKTGHDGILVVNTYMGGSQITSVTLDKDGKVAEKVSEDNDSMDAEEIINAYSLRSNMNYDDMYNSYPNEKIFE